MLKNSEDRRARRTRRLLKESLLELMREKPFSQISARDVTERADVNRTTFYLHYTGTVQLLQSVEEDLLAEAQSLIDAHLQEAVQSRTLRPVFEPILDFTVEHRKLCTLLFENNEASQFTIHLQRLFQRSGAEILGAWFQPRDPRQTAYLLEFVACGLIGMIAEWFRRGMDLPRAELLSAAERLVDGAAGQLLG